MSEHKNLNERLVEIEVKLDTLLKDFENHLSHHFRYSIMAWSLAAGAIVSLLLTLIKLT